MNFFEISVQLLSPAILVLLMLLARRTLQSIDERMNRHEDRIVRLEQDTVLKEDWLRESNIVRQRQECMLQKLAELQGQNSAALGIGAAIKRLTEKD